MPLLATTDGLTIEQKVTACLPTGATVEDIDKYFLAPKPDRVERIEEILETLAALGKARELAGDRYIAV